MDINIVFVCLGLFFVSILYSSVGHGGASGYLAILSLSTYATMENGWLKQQVWCLNLVVAAIAFYYYYKEGFFDKKLTIPFIIGSVPFAILGGFLKIDGGVYDLLLSITLIWAAYKLYFMKNNEGEIKNKNKNLNLNVSISTGAGIGLLSGIIGVGGGIFLSPIILMKRWADPKTVAATSALFIWVNSAAGLFGAGISHQIQIDLSILFPFIIVVLIGGSIGSKFGSRSNQNLIKSLLIIVLIVAATKQLFKIIL